MGEDLLDIPLSMEDILEALEEENCILVTGPELCLMKKGEGEMLESISDYISTNVVAGIPYMNDEGLFYCTTDDQNSDILTKIRRYYKGLQPHDMYQKLAYIPFHLVISLSPDVLLQKEFENNSLSFQADYHFPDENSRDIEKEKAIKPPTTASPLIYNLLGTYESKDSIVFTYEALFNYLTTIFTDNAARNYISECFKRSSIILFLGFRYDKWYLKLLFFLIKKKWIVDDDKYKRIKKQAVLFTKSTPSDNVLNFYKSEFKFRFSQLDQFKFVDELYDACETKQMLRGQKNTKVKMKSDLDRLITEKKMDDAIAMLPAFMNEDTRSDIESVTADYNDNLERYTNHEFIEEEYVVKRKKIFDKLRVVVNSIKIS